ncbi:hypothetical protein GCM10009838_52220 [Catenulispora subtropica]|uniref:Uncharacterized protein n=1 Tax=Catenulispora subtropica TaxID=450798 RepID=A0ABP5DSD8_9ACTN
MLTVGVADADADVDADAVLAAVTPPSTRTAAATAPRSRRGWTVRDVRDISPPGERTDLAESP